MLLSERHARLRAHDDEDTVDAAHRFVVDYFGGDHARASWFFDELVNRAGIDFDRPASMFYSIRHGRVKWHTLRSQA